MKTVNGFIYSTEKFDEYKYRAIIEFTVKDQDYPSKVDIYTTNPSKEEILKVIDSSKTEKVISFELVHFTTKESDDINSKIVDDWIKDLDN
jgi:hypothetical protein